MNTGIAVHQTTEIRNGERKHELQVTCGRCRCGDFQLRPADRDVGGQAAAYHRQNLDINTLDPSRGNGDTANIFMYAVYEPLIRLADDGSLLPLLAKSWDVSQNNTKFTFHLDPKAVFADGTAVDAKDVK